MCDLTRKKNIKVNKNRSDVQRMRSEARDKVFHLLIRIKAILYQKCLIPHNVLNKIKGNSSSSKQFIGDGSAGVMSFGTSLSAWR